MKDEIKEIKITPHRPDVKEKLFFLISGMIVSVPITLLFNTITNNFYIALPIFYATILSVGIITPFIEEFAKSYPLFYRHGETERSIFILGLLVGAGFGLSEFLIYVLVLGAPISIRLPAIFFHAASTSIVAYGIAKNRVIEFYLLAVALHLTNNLSALLLPGIIIFLTINVVTYLISWRLYFKTKEKFMDHNYWQTTPQR